MSVAGCQPKKHANTSYKATNTSNALFYCLIITGLYFSLANRIQCLTWPVRLKKPTGSTPFIKCEAIEVNACTPSVLLLSHPPSLTRFESGVPQNLAR